MQPELQWPSVEKCIAVRITLNTCFVPYGEYVCACCRYWRVGCWRGGCWRCHSQGSESPLKFEVVAELMELERVPPAWDPISAIKYSLRDWKLNLWLLGTDLQAIALQPLGEAREIAQNMDKEVFKDGRPAASSGLGPRCIWSQLSS
eukprot:2274069-Amphidinium_carterae.1